MTTIAKTFLLLLLFVSTAANGQEPTLQFYGVRTGGAVVTGNSSNSEMTIDIVNLSFHRFRFSSSILDGASLEHYCDAEDADGQGFNRGPYLGHQLCPNVPADNTARSQYIRRFLVRVVGPNASKYRVRYRCYIGYFGQAGHQPYKEQQWIENDWCGHERDGIVRWISKIVIQIERRVP